MGAAYWIHAYSRLLNPAAYWSQIPRNKIFNSKIIQNTLPCGSTASVSGSTVNVCLPSKVQCMWDFIYKLQRTKTNKNHNPRDAASVLGISHGQLQKILKKEAEIRYKAGKGRGSLIQHRNGKINKSKTLFMIACCL